MGLAKTGAMARKEIRELRRDRRQVALLIVMPLLLLLVFGYAASFDVDEVSTFVAGPQAAGLAPQLPEQLEVTATDEEAGRTEAEEALRRGDQVVAVVTGTDPVVLVDGTELFAARGVVAGLQAVPAAPPVEVLYNPELETAPVLVPALAGIVLMFVGVIATSLGVVRERQAGTMEQLAVMPLSPWDVLVGKVIPYFLLGLFDLVLVVAVSVWVFDVPFVGSPWVLALGGVLLLAVTLSLGLLVSSVSQTQAQAMQLGILVALPQFLLSGAIFPLDSMPQWLQYVAAVFPLTWFIKVARGVMLKGAGVDDLAVPLLVLAGMAVLFMALAVLRVRRDLTPTGGRRRAPAVPAVAQRT